MITSVKFFASNDALRDYNNVISPTINEFEQRMKEGFIPWLLQRFLNSSWHHWNYEWLFRDREMAYRLPVYFVTEDDVRNGLACFKGVGGNPATIFPLLMGTLPPMSWKDCSRFFEDFSYIEGRHDSERNPVSVPPVGANRSYSDIAKQLGELWQRRDDPKYSANDWLGLYIPFNGCGIDEPQIFIRVEKICQISEFNGLEQLGVLTVLLHEFGHALFDVCDGDNGRHHIIYPDQTYIKALWYVQEEALANAFAYRTIRTRALRNTSPGCAQIKVFMTSQPYPYALGTQIGEVRDPDLQKLIGWWIAAKLGKPLAGDPRNWLSQMGQPWPIPAPTIMSASQTLFK